MPNTNANHATHPPCARPTPCALHSSTVAIVSKPSTRRGQIEAVTVSALNRQSKVLSKPLDRTPHDRTTPSRQATVRQRQVAG